MWSPNTIYCSKKCEDSKEDNDIISFFNKNVFNKK